MSVFQFVSPNSPLVFPASPCFANCILLLQPHIWYTFAFLVICFQRSGQRRRCQSSRDLLLELTKVVPFLIKHPSLSETVSFSSLLFASVTQPSSYTHAARVQRVSLSRDHVQHYYYVTVHSHSACGTLFISTVFCWQQRRNWREVRVPLALPDSWLVQ